MPTIVMIGTLDTKGPEVEYVRGRLAEHGCDVLVVDAGVMGQSRYPVDVRADEVARAGGADRERLAAAGDRAAAIGAMSDGVRAILVALHDEGRLDGVMALGGSGGTSIAAPGMRALPIGVPKLIVSTLAAGDTRPYVGESDIAMLFPVVDIAGIHRISERILTNAAAAIAGMAAASVSYRPRGTGRPLIAATMFGVTTPCVTVARERLETLGYEVLVFHATGSGGRAMEALARAGLLAGVLDITTTELADELVGGVLTAGPERLEAAGAAGTPQVVSVGALDMVNFGPVDTVPPRFSGRTLHRHDPTITLMRTTQAECTELGRLMARKLGRARGPVAVYLPLRGVSLLDVPGGPFHDPDADVRLFDALRAGLGDGVELVEMDVDINDPSFGRAMADRLHDLVSSRATPELPAGMTA
jgi:uncharacterized protein (UPF0261 family)